MRVIWRHPGIPIRRHADWIDRIGAKNRKPGTSAPTLAASWSGPIEVLGALEAVEQLRGATIIEIAAEVQTSLDPYSGGQRNHDLVVRALLPSYERVIVCIEAKAGETFGDTVAEKRHAARETRPSAIGSCSVRLPAVQAMNTMSS